MRRASPGPHAAPGISLGAAALLLLAQTTVLVWWLSPNHSSGSTATCIQLDTTVAAASNNLLATAARPQSHQQQLGSGHGKHVAVAGATGSAPLVLGSSSRRITTDSLEQSLQQLLQGAPSITILGCTSEKLGSWKGTLLQAEVACVDTHCGNLEAFAQQQQQQQGGKPWRFFCISPRGGHPLTSAAEAGTGVAAAAAGSSSSRISQLAAPPAADTLVVMHDSSKSLPSAMLEAATLAGRSTQRIIVAETVGGHLTKLLSQDIATGQHMVYQPRHNKHGAAFGRIYSSASWGSEGNGSGPGSSVSATGSARQKILYVLRKYKVNRMIDSSCGGMLWMPLVIEEYRKDNPAFEYLGMDVVCPLIEKHTQTFKDKPYMSFKCVDASHEPIPQGYDLILSRDSLQHLPMADAFAFLHNVVNSGAKYLLVGSYLHRERNENLDHAEKSSGSITAYAVNLLQAPFLVQPAPLETMDEEDSGAPPVTKGMLLLDVPKLSWAESLDMW